ncbi:MFS transporter [Sphaerisporangium sp. B11E5]|uniref:MFS transporter n=1 Tax=Sphaerisporangium sp. B11E5 TaxID=3153563 RepID=UPI00325D73B2
MGAASAVDGADTGEPAPGSVSPGAASVVLAAAQLLVVLATSIVNVALPAIGRDLRLSAVGLAWVVNAYVLAFGALLLLGGRLGDVFGRRSVFLTGTVVFAAGSLAAGLAAGPAMLVAARAVQGVAAAMLAPTALGLVLTIFPAGPARGRALGLWGAVSGAGGAAGVLLGGVLTEVSGWRSVFLAVVPIAVAVLAAARWCVPADPADGGRVDLAGALTVTGGLVALSSGLSGVAGRGWAAWPTLGPVLAGLALLALFVVLQHRSHTPLVRPAVLRTGTVAAANLLMALLGAAWLALFFFLPLYQQHVLGYDPLAAGLTQLPLAVTITVSSMLAPRLVRWAGVRTVLAVALTTVAVGLAWLSATPVPATFLVAIGAPSVLIGAGLGVSFVLLTGLSAAGVPGADAGLAGGLINTSRQIGGGVGLAVLTTVAAVAGSADPRASASVLAAGYGAALAGAAVFAAVTAVLAPLLLPATPRRKEHP